MESHHWVVGDVKQLPSLTVSIRNFNMKSDFKRDINLDVYNTCLGYVPSQSFDPLTSANTSVETSFTLCLRRPLHKHSGRRP